MFIRFVAALALVALAAPAAAQSASIRASATVVSGPAIVQQAPAMFAVAERLSASLGLPVAARTDRWADHDPRMALTGPSPQITRAIRQLDPGAAPDEGSEFQADSEALTVWGWTEGAEDGSAWMVIADLSRD